ncbi:hypothetical protein M8Z33_24060 [Streptomyces sp. ZAF1911]|uniref:hypothetical protein n=1 Tax=Streptomyces sp. ZAF1911 TaxID=2944129 RepID=UPI00237B13A9|nr:hypothetical protein [Streptomyces sp. ZAF1911]MDD9379675.1 hypothetical protein [Streptomyces sp. ZAF1911]
MSGRARPPVSASAPTSASASDPSPVFVDSSGRRQRRVRRLGWLLVVPAAGYIVLLLSSLFGGPTLSSPLLPLPHPSQAAPDAAPSKAPAASPAPGSAGAPKRTGAAVSGASVSGAAQPPAAPSTAGPDRGATPRNTPGATVAPPVQPAPTTGPGTTPAPGQTNRGKSTSAPGQAGKPTTHP